MTRKKLLMLLGSICLALMLVAMACAGPAPTTPAPTTPAPTTPAPTTPAPSPEKEAIKWRYQSHLQAGDMGYLTHQRFCNMVKDVTGGRFEIELYPGGQLFSSTEALESLGAGACEMAASAGGYFVGQLGPIALFETGIPGSSKNVFERYNLFYTFRDGEFIKIIRNAFAKRNVYYLGPDLSEGWCAVSTVPIKKMEDFKGLKFRVFGMEAKWYEAMGATTVLISGEELYTALATGVVDIARWGSVYTSGCMELST